jgi:hypothetical protein
LCTAWAEAYPGDPASSGLGVFSYVGPVITRRGDRLGTPLNAVRKHWVRSWQYLADVSGGPGPNYAHLARTASASLYPHRPPELATDSRAALLIATAR